MDSIKSMLEKKPCHILSHSTCCNPLFYEYPAVYQEALDYFKQKGIELSELIHASPSGWRCRSKLAIRGKSAKPLIGLFEEGTHQVVDLIYCETHHPKINQALAWVREIIQTNQITPYNEFNHSGLLRYVQFVVERSTQKVQLVFVLNCEEEALLPSFKFPDSSLIHSVWFNYNTSKTNNIFGPKWRLFKGEPLVWEELANVQVCFHPASFAQANLALFERMLNSIRELVGQNHHVAEYYAGVGAIGLAVAQQSASVICCEVTPQAEECFLLATQKLPLEVASKIKFEAGLAATKSKWLEEVDAVIVDPPRKGLDRLLLDALKQSNTVKTLIYVSCGWKSFQRDCEELLAAGWKLARVEPYFFFPGSNHLEILAKFDKL